MSSNAVSVLRQRFPGLVSWFGHRTGVWWAALPVTGGWRLVEAADPEQLTHAVIKAAAWPGWLRARAHAGP
jgi:hypothetical protein